MRERPDLGSFAYGPTAVDYERRADPAEVRAARAERARAALADSDCDGLLVWKDENVRFLSGLRAQIIQGKSALLNGCLLREDGAMALFLSGGEVDRARAAMPWIEEVHPIPIMEARGLIAGAFEEVIAPALDRLDLTRARLGWTSSPTPRWRRSPAFCRAWSWPTATGSCSRRAWSRTPASSP